ncbi:type II toxin-antitoxin system Phd/YefM family antitoxin [Rhodopila globiformis]|nr:type II toxin-antitoxin system Phd/YefM family antitoxin [Rhodopila globiformis]
MTTRGHIGLIMREMQLREAKAAFSSVVDNAASGHETVVTKHGSPVAVVLGYEQWRTLKGAKPSFASLLLSFPDVGEIERDQTPPRDLGL